MTAWFGFVTARLSRFRRLPAGARSYVIEMVVYLAAARVALRVVPFRKLVWFFERRPRPPAATFAERKRIMASSPAAYPVREDEIAGVEREQLRQGVLMVLGEAVHFLPGATVCFPRAIAAQAMLRRLGIGTTLCYGAACPGRRLATHVWLQDGEEGFLGHHTARSYAVLACYPDSRQRDLQFFTIPGGKDDRPGNERHD